MNIIHSKKEHKHKILITNFHVKNGGGHNTYINSLLKSKMFEYHVACPSSSDTYKSLSGYKNLVNITFPSKPKEIMGIVKSFRHLKKYIIENEIEAIHSNGSPDNRMAIYLKYWMLFFKNKSIKIIHTKHNSYPVNGVASTWRMKKACDAVIFVCSDAFNKAGSPEDINYAIIENGVDINYWKEPVAEKTDTKIHLVSIAGIASYKRWDILLDALNSLHRSAAEKFSVTLVGGVPVNHTLLIKKASEVGYELNFIDKTATPKEHLKYKDIGFVLSDKTETISFACREMMAYGMPVIVSDFSGLPDNITDGHDGWITKKGNAESVREILIHLSTLSQNDLFTLKSNAQQKAINAFSIEKMIDMTNSITLMALSNQKDSDLDLVPVD